MTYISPWGRQSWFRVHFTPYKDNGLVIGANIIIEDITEKKKNEAELLDKANRDPLTGTYNRNALESILVERLDVSKQDNLISYIAAVDIDDFKNINDTFGHGVGDSVLIHVADRIKQQLKEMDLVIRTGGDEFLVYLHDIKSKEDALDYTKKIFEVLSSPYYFGDSVNKKDINLDLSCSIGISIFPNDGETVEELMLMADNAMYGVKKSGKGTYAFA
jgi:diguanylate cyclase (GGDEF)-like protein